MSVLGIKRTNFRFLDADESEVIAHTLCSGTLCKGLVCIPVKQHCPLMAEEGLLTSRPVGSLCEESWQSRDALGRSHGTQ